MSDPHVDPQQPWLGLNSFTEETRQFFHGREEEVAELARRVQRKPLTVLFGQSGLGKTSIVRAGLVPRLRAQDFCPVYVRLDYAPGTPSPAEQIKQAIFRETEAAGRWTHTGVSVEGESLWEFLHHRDDQLVSPEGRVLTPLLIFDQFEEIFTLAQTNDFGRARAADITAQLADLVENRPPRELEERLDTDDTIAERFDFARCDYRILIVLREDYLAHLEVLKSAMPSVTQNRMRIARMTGQQALDAVLKPGGSLVSQEVAEAIVRFVAGGTELRNAEVEPSLLSLICRELNAARIEQGKPEISTDLLAGSHASILATFYDRALADQPAGVHRFIEEELLTESGFRENLAEEKVRKAFAEAGAAPDALAQLVDRRLLRIEERLDIRRVELTHDVLCDVVRSARDTRHEREAREAAEHALAEQREREAATRRALKRARTIAVACAGLAAIAIGAAGFGIWGMREAQHTHALADTARGESERLIVYLLDDFYRELEPVGRLDIVGELAKRALDYYKGLPDALHTQETKRNQALAQVRYGAVLRTQGRLKEAAPLLDTAIATLSQMRSAGDTSEVTAIGLALGYAARARVIDSGGFRKEALEPSNQAVAVLDSLPGDASVPVRRARGAVLTQLGFVQLRQALWPQAVQSLERARVAYRSIDGLKADGDAAANFAITSAWLVETLGFMGRDDDARRIYAEGRDAATTVLERNPTNMLALRGRALISSTLGAIEERQLRLARARSLAEAAAADWTLVTRIDPTNVIAWNNYMATSNQALFDGWKMGRLRESFDRMTRVAAEVEPRVGRASMLATQMAQFAFEQSWALADLGDSAKSDAALKQRERWMPLARAGLPAGSSDLAFLKCRDIQIQGFVSRVKLDWSAAAEQSRGAIACLDKVPAATPLERLNVIDLRRDALISMGLASIARNENAQAEGHIRAALAAAKDVPQDALDEQQRTAHERLWLALAVARQGRRDEARELIRPVVDFLRRMRSLPESSDAFEHAYLAAALGVGATVEEAPGARKALLDEARAVYAALPPEMKATNTLKFIAQSIDLGGR